MQLAGLCRRATAPGVLVVSFAETYSGPPIAWQSLEPWTRSRAVTLAHIAAPLAVPALDVALTADLVLLREGLELILPPADEPLPVGLLWAFGRAGRAALTRGLLREGPVRADEALGLGLVQELLPVGAPLPLPAPVSLPALTAARDLMRATAVGAPQRQLELATFRLLFAQGDPNEGARAFLERRQPVFPDG